MTKSVSSRKGGALYFYLLDIKNYITPLIFFKKDIICNDVYPLKRDLVKDFSFINKFNLIF